MTRFEFATATRIVFGPGCASQLPGIAKELGAVRPLVVTGNNPSRWAEVVGALQSAGLRTSSFTIGAEPTLARVRQGADLARACDSVIAIGGGSVIDGAKAIAALATNAGDVLDYLEVIGKSRPLTAAPLPFFAVPTTAGTGSEVTRNAVLASPEHGVKASLRSPMMLAKAAIVDPDLTRELPPHLTASTGLDALTQLIEPYVTPRANHLTDALCLDGMRRAAVHLPRAFADGNDTEARENMSLASLYGGLALANAGLGVVHGFAAPIGGMFDAPHGAVCAAVLPHGMKANLQALRERAKDQVALTRYAEVARTLTGDSAATAEDGVRWVSQLCGRLKVPPLRTYGIGEGHIQDLVDKAAKASSMKANPIVLTAAELTHVMEHAL
ncbi:MAG TPA: iron-containing alcohol dehydrogenase [Bryobacteraceae bacterium]